MVVSSESSESDSNTKCDSKADSDKTKSNSNLKSPTGRSSRLNESASEQEHEDSKSGPELNNCTSKDSSSSDEFRVTSNELDDASYSTSDPSISEGTPEEEWTPEVSSAEEIQVVDFEPNKGLSGLVDYFYEKVGQVKFLNVLFLECWQDDDELQHSYPWVPSLLTLEEFIDSLKNRCTYKGTGMIFNCTQVPNGTHSCSDKFKSLFELTCHIFD